MSPEFRLQDYSATHVGNVRAENEDSLASVPQARVWVVADGMGGHAQGKFASETIVRLVAETEFPPSLEDACEALSGAVQAANREIFERSLDAGHRMGSTFVGLVIRGGEFAILWSGDSRAYIWRDGQLIGLTQDHTQTQVLIDSGLLTWEEALDHPMKNVLVRAVGVEEELQIDAVRDTIESRDLYLLCSDGLHGVIPDEDIAAIIAREGEACCEALIAECIARGAPDNVTVTVVSAREPTLLVPGGDG